MPNLLCLQVMAHPWFDSIDWDALREAGTRPEQLESPYDFDSDFNAASGHSGGALAVVEALSSAESIDPEDNAKYFADF